MQDALFVFAILAVGAIIICLVLDRLKDKPRTIAVGFAILGVTVGMWGILNGHWFFLMWGFVLFVGCMDTAWRAWRSAEARKEP